MSGFIHNHGLWTNSQTERAQDVLAALTDKHLRTVRVSMADPHGKLRGKTLMPQTFRIHPERRAGFHHGAVQLRFGGRHRI